MIALIAVSGFILNTSASEAAIATRPAINIPDVPFYSQFNDISDPEWKKLSCGIASLAMIIDFYDLNTVSVNSLLDEGIKAGAYIYNAGWSHNGLALLAKNHGLEGNTYDFSGLSDQDALERFVAIINEGPVIASVHYTFDPANPIPHLAVITGIDDGTVYYNDPAGSSDGGKISIDDFMKVWKKRLVVVRP